MGVAPRPYYRTSMRTKARKLYYYRCLGSDDYRYEHGGLWNQPVRADYLDHLVWNQVTALLADPSAGRTRPAPDRTARRH